MTSNKAISILIILTCLAQANAISSDEKMKELLPTIQDFYGPKYQEKMDNELNLDVMFGRCLDFEKDEKEFGSMLEEIYKLQTFEELKSAALKVLKDALNESFKDADNLETINSLDKEKPELTISAGNDVLDSVYESFQKAVSLPLRAYLTEMFYIKRSNQAAAPPIFKLKLLVEEAVREIEEKAFMVVDVIHVPENAKKYKRPSGWWQRFVDWVKSLFGAKNGYKPSKEYVEEKKEKYHTYLTDEIFSQILTFHLCLGHFDDVYALIHNYYRQIEIGVNVALLKLQEGHFKGTDDLPNYIEKAFAWMNVVRKYTHIGMTFSAENQGNIALIKSIAKQWSDALKVHRDMTVDQMTDSDQVYPSFWRVVEYIRNNDREVALKLMKHFWVGLGLKFATDRQKENLAVSQKLVTYFELPKEFTIAEYSYLLAALCLYLPDDKELKKPVVGLSKIIEGIIDKVTLVHLPFQLISGNSKIFYARIILAREGFKLPDIQEVLNKDLLLDFDQPFHHIDGFSSWLDNELDNKIWGTRGDSDIPELYPVLKLVNLWSANDKQELQKVKIHIPKNKWISHEWVDSFQQIDTKGKLNKSILQAYEAQGKGELSDFMNEKGMKKVMDLEFTWEQVREIQPEIADLMDAKRRLVVV